jgi:hypothetical protein
VREWVHKIFGGKGKDVDEEVNKTKKEFLAALYRLEALAIETRVRGRTPNVERNYNVGGIDMDGDRGSGGDSS